MALLKYCIYKVVNVNRHLIIHTKYCTGKSIRLLGHIAVTHHKLDAYIQPGACSGKPTTVRK
jgi:hypothetical protein